MKDVFDKWLNEERKTPTRGKMTKKQQAALYDKTFHESSPFTRLFKKKKENK